LGFGPSSFVLPPIDRTPKHYIGGKQARPDSGYSRPVYGPGGQLIGEVGDGNRKDIRNAVEAARAAAKWGDQTAHNRAQILYYIGENLDARGEEFAARLRAQTGANVLAILRPNEGRAIVDWTTDERLTPGDIMIVLGRREQLAAVAALAGGQPYAGTFAVQATKATWTERKVAAGAENLAYPAAEGEKWVDVNLSAHTMTAYEGARAVIGPVAMVNGAPATPTVQGTFHIYSKTPLMTMRGSNADGTNYEAPDVPWVAFFTGGYALHGAYWRSSFGYAASHGCVNLPVSVAKQVYDWAPVGTPVVTHG